MPPRRSPSSRARALVLPALLLLGLAAIGCAPNEPSGAPKRYLAITHSAIDRVSFFDLDARRVVGVLPTQKLPHDMLVTPDGRSLYVVNSGAQSLSVFDLGAPSLWRQARAFMTRDTARARGAAADRPLALASRALADGVERHALTSHEFPSRADSVHARVNARAHTSCTDCHDRSVGARPFAPAFARERTAIRLVHLAEREIVELDAATLAQRQRWPLPIPEHYAPIEAWVKPGTDTAFVTCRDSIGTGKTGIVSVVALASGREVARLTPGVFPWHLLPTPDGRQLVINNFQSSRLAIVDLASLRVVDSITVENGPAGMLFTDGGRTLLVSCFYTGRVLSVDFGSRVVKRRMDVGSNPTSLLATGDGARVWVLCGGESALELLDARTGKIVEKHALLFGAYALQPVPPTIHPS